MSGSELVGRERGRERGREGGREGMTFVWRSSTELVLS